jgi:LuxR family maltose regulon positive regulatory protein
MAWLRQAQGDINGSIAAIRTALQLAQHREVSHAWPVPSATCAQARLWIAQGNFAAARQWAQQVAPHLANSAPIFLHEVEYLTLARLHIAQGEYLAAEPVLLKLQQQATADKREGSLIEILIVQALAFAAQERENAALAALGQALDLAEREGYIRLFLDEGAPLAALLRRAVSHNLHTDYALHLLDAMGDGALATAPLQPLPEPLSERELEVLRRVAAGYSNGEIAQELVVALSTVKRHISNIYGKLNVGSRTQAIAKAKELGLL